MKTLTFKLDYKKSTKNTYVYGEQNTNSPVAVLYVKRSAMPEGETKTITVEVSVDE